MSDASDEEVPSWLADLLNPKRKLDEPADKDSIHDVSSESDASAESSDVEVVESGECSDESDDSSEVQAVECSSPDACDELVWLL